jgi:hypothetical protein
MVNTEIGRKLLFSDWTKNYTQTILLNGDLIRTKFNIIELLFSVLD